MDYAYNIRGWLNSINDPDNLSGDLFGERLLYETPESGLTGSTDVQHNGNISGMVWNSDQKSKQGYRFTYDGINRLTLGDYKYYSGGWNDNNNYEEKSLAYDLNGNIMRLIHTNSSGGNDADFTYAYSGNQLSNINSGTTYSYDLNGNTLTDGLRGMTIGYNILNLPSSISKSSESISYIYSATGEKLAKRDKNNLYRYYAGSMVYDNNKSLSYILFEEGLVNKSSGAFTYEYHLKDHLGNTRVAFQPNGGGTTTTQVAEYYPFGSSYLPFNPAGTNKYLYNGKEKQDDQLSGTYLDWYDYGARFYDARIGRWHVIDGKAEKYFSLSPYLYCANDPIRYLDPDGNKLVDANGNEMYNQKIGWTKYATEDAKRLNRAMMQSDKSRLQWNKLIDSRRNVQIEFNSDKYENNENANGTAKPNFIFDQENNEWKISDSKITIWLGALKESIVNGTKSKGLSLEEAIAAAAAHEIDHSVDENNIQLQEQRANEQNSFEKERLKEEIEIEPTKTGDQVREEFRRKPKKRDPESPEL